MLCYVIAYLDRVNLGFAKLRLLSDLGFSESVYGIGAGVFFAGYIVFGVPANLLLHRIGARLCITLIMVTWGVASGLMAFVETTWQFFLCRFLLGAAEAGFYPGVILYLTSWFPRTRRAVAMSSFQSAIPLAGVLGGPVSGWILDHLNDHQSLRGWQWLFLLEASPAVVISVVVWFYLANSAQDARWLSPEQKEILRVNIARESLSGEPSGATRVFIDPRIWALSALTFALIMGLYTVGFWMPTLLKEAGSLSLSEVGYLSVIPNLVPLLAMYLFARSSDRNRERRRHVALAASLGALGLFASVFFSHSVPLALIGLSLAQSGIMSALPLQWTFLTAFVRAPAVPLAIALVNSIASLGGIVSPILIGWLKDETLRLDVGIYVVAACVAAAAAIALCFDPRLVNK